MNKKLEVLLAVVLISAQPLFAGDSLQSLTAGGVAAIQQEQMLPVPPQPREVQAQNRGGFSFSMSAYGGSVSAPDYYLSVGRGRFNYQADGYSAWGNVSGRLGQRYRMTYQTPSFPGQTFTVEANYYGPNNGYGVSGIFMGNNFAGTIVIDRRYFPYSGAGGGVNVNVYNGYFSGYADGSGMSKAAVTILTAFMSTMYEDAYNYVPPQPPPPPPGPYYPPHPYNPRPPYR